MKQLLEIGNLYAKESDWKDFALVKICLCSMGILIGGQISAKYRKRVTEVAAVLFLFTYIPLMIKLFRILMRRKKETAL